MNERQKRFCNEYLKDLNATQAAIRAGYSQKTAKQIGQRLLTKVDLQSYLQKRMKEAEKTRIASADEVLEYLSSVVRGTSRSSQFVSVKGTPVLTEKPPTEAERIKAAELLGKAHGAFRDRIDASLSIPVIIDGGKDLEG